MSMAFFNPRRFGYPFAGPSAIIVEDAELVDSSSSARGAATMLRRREAGALGVLGVRQPAVGLRQLWADFGVLCSESVKNADDVIVRDPVGVAPPKRLGVSASMRSALGVEALTAFDERRSDVAAIAMDADVRAEQEAWAVRRSTGTLEPT